MKKIGLLIKTISEIEEKLGIRKLIEYTLFFALLYAFFNFSAIVESVMAIQEKIAKQEHERRLLLRDELMEELPPILVELRTKAGAQRVLYFEYHNSTENFAGIPFKYANLVAVKQEYGSPGFDKEIYKDINAGLLGNMYIDLVRNEVLRNSRKEFEEKYPEISSFFSSHDGSKVQMFINIPGVNAPLGMIVVEWLEPVNKTGEEWVELENWVVRQCVPRINRLISSKSR
jgi:hypothetical protein